MLLFFRFLLICNVRVALTGIAVAVFEVGPARATPKRGPGQLRTARGGGNDGYPPPPEISKTKQDSDKRQTELDTVQQVLHFY